MDKYNCIRTLPPSVMEFLSGSLFAPIVLSLVLILLAVVFLQDKKKRYPPVAGTVVHQLMNASRIHHYMTILACKYKTYMILDLFKYAVYTIDPANVEYVLKTNFANYGKEPYLNSIMSDVVGDVMITVDGGKWQHQRKTSSSQISSKVLRVFSSEIFRNNAVKLSRIIQDAVTCGEGIDIQDFLTKSTLDSIVKILLDIDLDTIGGNEESIQFSNAFDEANEALIYRIADIFWKIKRFFNIGREAVIRSNMKIVDQFIYKLLKSKTRTVHVSENKLSLKKRDFISRLLETGETDPKYLRDMVLFLIAAGTDTTASGLSWFLYMMCKHPHIQETIAEEIREATNMKICSSIDDLAANLTEEALNKMHYLHAALTETLRLYPPVPMDAKSCHSDDTLPDGYCVRKGELLVYLPYAMGRMNCIWGNDAEEFRPERWLGENGIFQEEIPFKFISFNAGPKICLGKDYAYIQMKIFSSVLLGSYIFKLNDDNKEVNYKAMFTLHIDGGLYVRASPRFDHARKLD